MIKISFNTLENWLWGISSRLRDHIDASKYKNYIPLLIFMVWSQEFPESIYLSDPFKRFVL